MENLSVNEKLTIYLARHLKDKEFGYVGTGSLIGMAACLLAQELFAPDLSWIAGESGYINPAPPLVKSISGYHPRTEATKSVNAIMRYQGKGMDFYLAEVTQMDGSAQINQSYNINNAIGLGTASSPYLLLAKRTYFIVKEQNQDILPRNVSFVSARRDISKTDNETCLITPYIVIRWKYENEPKAIITEYFSPMKDINELKTITGFEFIISESLKPVLEPTEEEIIALHEIDSKEFLKEDVVSRKID